MKKHDPIFINVKGKKKKLKLIAEGDCVTVKYFVPQKPNSLTLNGSRLVGSPIKSYNYISRISVQIGETAQEIWDYFLHHKRQWITGKGSFQE
jgi:hypothetical protein